MQRENLFINRLMGDAAIVEGSVLLAICRDLTLWDNSLKENDFYCEESKPLLKIITLATKQGIDELDEITLKRFMTTNQEINSFINEIGIKKLITRIESAPKNFNSHYNALLKRNYLMTLKNYGVDIFAHADKINELTFEETKVYFEDLIANIDDRISELASGIEMFECDLTDEMIEEMLNGEIFENLKFNEYAPKLNYLTHGCVLGSTMLLCAPSNTGKSTFALSMIIYPIIKKGEKVVLISNEMTHKQYIQLLVSIIAYRELGIMELNRSATLNGKIEKREQLIKIQRYMRKYLKGNLMFITYHSGEIDVIKKLMKIHAKNGVKLVVYDNLKPENSASNNAWAQLEESCKELTFLAQELNMCFLAPFQVAPSSVNNRVLTMADLSESKGVIKMASTCLMFRKVMPDEFDGGEYEIKPYQYVINQSGRRVVENIPFKEEDGKKYIVLSVVKNRFGEVDKNILYEFISSYGVYKEIGYCTLGRKKIKGGKKE